jgi:hypothetical protein
MTDKREPSETEKWLARVIRKEEQNPAKAEADDNALYNDLVKRIEVDRPKIIEGSRPQRIVTLKIVHDGAILEFGAEWERGWRMRKIIVPADWSQNMVEKALQAADNFERRLQMEATT